LVSLTCEHGKRTYECDECRYETGFVRLPASLGEGGLFTTTHVERAKVAVPLLLTGELRFDERRVGHLSTQVQGVIKQVHVALGDRVHKGQPLITLESVAVGDGQSEYLEAQALLGLHERNFSRVSELRKANIASDKEFLQAQQEFETAQIRVTSARSRLDRLGSTGTAGGRVVLRSPMQGTVLVMHAVSGELARPDEVLLTVGDSSSLWVWADLYERDLAAVRAGQAEHKLAAALSVKAYPGQEFPATLELVSPALDEVSRTIKVRLQAPNDDGRLLAGMFTTVRLFLPGTQDAAVLPETALVEDERRSFVFVHYRDDYYVRRPVTVGRRWDGLVELLAGPDPSQPVVTEGSFLMKSDVLRSKMGAGCAD